MEKKRVCPIEIALGLALMGQKKLAGTVESLEKKGTNGKRQSQEFLHAVQSEGAKCKQVIGKQFRASAKKAMGEYGFVTADDVAKVHKEIKELKKMLKPAPSAKT
ncbi:MAG: hypothetical protein PF904_11495 [Kiritimatiellae bacterium]|jgi:polyhydroxyalkanoate synthesis regulator phasin|nr:hypothetical protein [Kiritimatiellia bacterium]